MTIEVSDEIRRNFKLFWDNFPFAVTLVYKDRTIVEVNKAAQELGYPVGIRCIDMGEKKHHAHCKAHIALRDKTGVRTVAYYDFLEKVIDGYWIPLAGSEDLFVHFGIDITPYAAESLFPACGADASGACRCGEPTAA